MVEHRVSPLGFSVEQRVAPLAYCCMYFLTVKHASVLPFNNFGGILASVSLILHCVTDLHLLARVSCTSPQLSMFRRPLVLCRRAPLSPVPFPVVPQPLMGAAVSRTACGTLVQLLSWPTLGTVGWLGRTWESHPTRQ